MKCRPLFAYKSEEKCEVIGLFIIFLCIFFLSTIHVKEIISIWNQNDEFGVWQGGAWVLGLDWSEVVSTNYYYGHGYGFLLAFFIKFFGNNSIKMTQMAIYFQALIHASCIFIARGCIKKIFPSVNAVRRLIGATVCVLSIPDLYYTYLLYSECLLRFLVWIQFGVIVSYSYEKKWYKLLLINIVSVYAFSVHQRCILLLALAACFTIFEVMYYLINKPNCKTIIWIMLMISIIIVFYFMEYKFAQKYYIDYLYTAKGNSSVGGNLLSERGYSLKSIFRDVVLNFEIEKIAIQNLMGCIYYICAIDCGFVLYGFIVCLEKIKSGKSNNFTLYIYAIGLFLGGIILTAYQNANERAYTRVELMHYGRYFSYLLGPLLMLGIMGIFVNYINVIRKRMIYITIFFLASGITTYNVLKTHNVTYLYAFDNTCPGIKSMYYNTSPYIATMYHVLLGIIWIIVPMLILIKSKKLLKFKLHIEVSIFIVIVGVWINIANREWNESEELKKPYIMQTYDLQKTLKGVDEFVAFKSYPYGSGLLQYNNMFSKIHVCQTLDEFGEEENGLLVVSQNSIDEMSVILDKYETVYANEYYIVWRYDESSYR